MTLRWKIALALAGLTFVASAAVGAAVYRVTRDRLLSEIDRSLAEVNPRPGRGSFELDQLGDRGPLRGFEAQLVLADGTVVDTTFERPSSDLAEEAAPVAGRPGISAYDTVAVDGDDRLGQRGGDELVARLVPGRAVGRVPADAAFACHAPVGKERELAAQQRVVVRRQRRRRHLELPDDEGGDGV